MPFAPHLLIATLVVVASSGAAAQMPPLPTGPGGAPPKPAAPITAGAVKVPALPGTAAGKDSIKPMQDTAQTQMQQVTERQGKAAATNANIQKKQADTTSTTSGNLK